MGSSPGKRTLPSLVLDENRDLKIRRIYYWTEALPEDLFEIWAQRRNDAFAQYALNFINA
jgi:hypothetical protein